MVEHPAGILTFVFTDIEISVELWERHRAAFQGVFDEHNRIVYKAAQRWNGIDVQGRGDGFLISFLKASDAVRFAAEVQHSVTEHDWQVSSAGGGGDRKVDLRVRIGIHTGEALPGEYRSGAPDYFGPVVNRAARIVAAAHGGQILISNVTRELAQVDLPPTVTFHDLATHRLRGIGDVHLYQVADPGLPHEFPPLKSIDPDRHNLPLPTASFIGRENEIPEWHRLLLRPEVRLLTLTGFGGIGKTRAALQLAELSLDDFEDGVWWVELEESRTGEGLIQRAAYHLRLPLQAEPSVKDQLYRFLRPRRLLMVLDSAEQIPDAAAAIHETLMNAPHVKCLVTSRRALELRGERRVEVPPLACPDAQALFVERARLQRAGFCVEPVNEGDIEELCRGLEGVPLAIEIAASRIVGMTPREMVSRLSERFRLLRTRAPDLPARQRALRATIDWSYELLAEDERSLFAELAVFAGGFALADVEAVCDVEDAWEGVMELRRHSLLSAETDAATQRTRFGMLDSVRQYAAEKLDASSGGGEQVWRSHAVHFLRFAEEQVALMRTRDEARALDELGREFDNLRAAMAWAQASGQGETCARLALALYQWLYRRGFWAEARRRLETGRAAIEGQGGDLRRLNATILYHLASLADDMGHLAEARRQAEASLAVQRELDDRGNMVATCNLLGLIARNEGNLEAAQQCFESALSEVSDQDHTMLGHVSHNLGLLARSRGDVDEARRLYREGLAHYRAAGDVHDEAVTLGNLGAIAHLQDRDYAEARHLYNESLGLRRTLGDRYGIAVMLNNLGEIAELEGEIETAVVLFLHAERLLRELQSAHVSAPTENLKRLAERLGIERWAAMRVVAEQARWEEVVESDRLSPSL